MFTRIIANALIVCLSLGAIQTETFASHLIASYNVVGFMGTSKSTCPNPMMVNLFLEHDSVDFSHVVQLGAGQQYWAAGAAGIYDFAPTNTQNFAEFASLLTDGQDDFLLEYLYVEDCGGGNIGGDSESSRLGGVPDLIGNNLEFIRLIVHDIAVDPYDPPCECGPGTQFDADITWQFWGTPVPEPATLGLLSFAIILNRRRKRT